MERSSTLTGRLTGLATMIGGMLWAVGASTGLSYDSLGITMTAPHVVLTVGGLLVLIGLARLARHQARDYGRVSQTGAFLAAAGVVVIIFVKNSTIPDESAWKVFYLGAILVVIGSLLFGTVALRKQWRFAAPFLAIGVLGVSNVVLLMGPFDVSGAEYVGTVVLPILIGFGWSALGYALWSDEAKASSGAYLEGI